MKLRKPDTVYVDAPAERLETELRETCLRVTLACEQAVSLVRLEWNLTPEEIRNESVKVFSDCWERGYGDLQWSGLTPFRQMPWAFAVSNGSDSDPDARGRFTECFGVKVRPGALCTWQYEPGRVTLNLDVRNGGRGVQLGKRTLNVCDVVLGEYRDESAFSALKNFYRLLCDDPLLLPAPVYGSNNWYYAYGKSNRQQILTDARLISRLCEGSENRPFMVIDAGWNRHWGSGPWLGNNPDYGDMKSLADEIAATGAVPGLWVRYLSDEEGDIRDLSDECRLERNRKYLDPSHPEVIRSVRSTTRRISAEWGYRLIKHDFSCFDICGYWGFQRPDALTDGGWGFYDHSRTTAEIMVDLYRAIYASAAPGTILLACNVPGFLTAGLAHINRAGDDTSGQDWARTRRMGVNTLAFRTMCDGAFYKADYDCVGVIRDCIPWELNQKWLDLLSHSGTPLFLSLQPDALDGDQLAVVSRALARGAKQTDTAVPLDWMENCCPERWLIDGQEQVFDWRG